jgi:hypothetical protein
MVLIATCVPIAGLGVLESIQSVVYKGLAENARTALARAKRPLTT